MSSSEAPKGRKSKTIARKRRIRPATSIIPQISQSAEPPHKKRKFSAAGTVSFSDTQSIKNLTSKPLETTIIKPLHNMSNNKMNVIESKIHKLYESNRCMEQQIICLKAQNAHYQKERDYFKQKWQKQTEIIKRIKTALFSKSNHSKPQIEETKDAKLQKSIFPESESCEEPSIASFEHSDDASMSMSVSNESISTKSKSTNQKNKISKLMQTLLPCPKMIKKMPSNIEKDRILINKTRKLSDPHQQRQFFFDLSKQHIHLQRDCFFYIGNSYEVQKDYFKAIKFYTKAIQINIPYISSLAIHHKFVCMKESAKFKKIEMMQFVKFMKANWSSQISKIEIENHVIFEQLLGNLYICLDLSEFYENEYDSKWNDESLTWYKKGMNILEKMQIFKIDKIPILNVIDSLNDKMSECKVKIERKRLDATQNVQKKVWKNAEMIITNFMHCLIEYFRQKDYEQTNKIEDLWKNECFYEYAQNKEKYEFDFDIYLRLELDSLFEICHFLYFENRNASKNTNSQISDVYINYATFLVDFLSDFEGAELWYLEALKYNDLDPTTHCNLAEIYEKTKRYEMAKTSYKLSLDLAKKSSEKEEYESLENDVDEAMKRIQNL